MASNSAPTTLRFVVVAGEQYVEVSDLVAALREQGEERAARMLAESAAGKVLDSWRVRP